MSKSRVGVKQALNNTERDDFFVNTDALNASVPEGTGTSILDEDNFKRATYYLTQNLIQSINLMSALENKDKSEVVREVLLNNESLIKYMRMIENLE